MYINGQLHKWICKESGIDPALTGCLIWGLWVKRKYVHYYKGKDGVEREMYLKNMETNETFDFTKYLKQKK